MSRFRVGQRVKLVRGIDLVSPAKNMGLEGRISHLQSIPKGTLMADGRRLRLDCDCGVEWEGQARWRAQHTAQLEPILDQHQPCDADFKRDLDRMLDKEEVR